jgi:hypothetical protein
VALNYNDSVPAFSQYLRIEGNYYDLWFFLAEWIAYDQIRSWQVITEYLKRNSSSQSFE